MHILVSQNDTTYLQQLSDSVPPSLHLKCQHSKHQRKLKLNKGGFTVFMSYKIVIILLQFLDLRYFSLASLPLYTKDEITKIINAMAPPI